MNAPRILVVEPDPCDPVGRLGEWLSEQGAELDVRHMPHDAVPDELDEHDAVLCLGGRMNAEADAEHPWLRSVRGLLSRALTEDKPTLGVCLGAQLLTVAAGGRVTPAPDGPEVGPKLVAKKDAAWVDPLFSDLPLMQDVFQFHGDVIERLPPQAELLASSPHSAHQAYRLRRRVYAIQFHIETTPDVVRDLVRRCPDMASSARPDAFDDAALAEMHDDIAETWRPFAHRFADLAAGRLSPVEPRYTLPLA
ncbi:type 1 glutamine amidotransferase [Saccharomonospora saliphila]|uniref:type 1 glutamine amidotransferase n=1 Tax=Saccharomonospora saliphila TaxID=369829 RepID=UPI00048C49DA|nr:type 1 glutamine amidotransferase [Saccharomonospora saliphila]